MSNNFLPFDIDADIEQCLNDGEDDGPSRNNYKMISENREYKAQTSSNNRSIYDRQVSLPKKRKAWFLFSYSSFLFSYLVLVLVIAYTYPLKPICNIDDFNIRVFENKESPNITQEMKNSVSLVLNFINRNPLISYLYDDFLNITIYYYSRKADELIYFANTKARGFHQHNRRNKKVEVPMSVSGVPFMLQQQQNESSSSIFLVNLVFNVRFKCRMSCTQKGPLFMNLSMLYQFSKQVED